MPKNRASVRASVVKLMPLFADNAPIVPRVITDVIAVGPSVSTRALPNKPYIITGTILAYKPTIGGRPASKAYARLCGTSITATVKPAMVSPNKSSRR